MILVVEDDPNDALLLRLAFKKARSSATLHFALNGPEAIRYLSGRGRYGARFAIPDLFLVDLKLPGMSGFEVLDWVRQRPSLHLMLVGVLSGSEYQEEIQKAYGLGASFYIIKPNDLDDLVVIARQLTQDHLVAVDAPVKNPPTHQQALV